MGLTNLGPAPQAPFLQAGGKDNGQAGIVAPSSLGWAFGTRNATANRAFYARVRPSRNVVVTKINFVVTVAAGSNDACDVGIYDATGAKIVTAGATLGLLNSTGVKSVTITTTTLTAGMTYYVGFSFGAVGTTAATVAAANFNSVGVAEVNGTATGTVEMGIQDTAHPLPVTATLTVNTLSSCIALWLRES